MCLQISNDQIAQTQTTKIHKVTTSDKCFYKNGEKLVYKCDENFVFLSLENTLSLHCENY